jgi:superfamily II DNA or RNA helicase
MQLSIPKFEDYHSKYSITLNDGTIHQSYTQDKSFQPRPHQRDGFKHAIECTDRCFIIEAVMGSGKNKLIQMIAKYYQSKKQKVLIITDLTSVIDQLKQEAYTFLMYDTDIFSCAKVTRNVSILNKYDILIIDECHVMFTKILDYVRDINTNIRVIGFTATATNPRLLDYYQSIKCIATYNQMLKLGYLVPAKFFGVPISHSIKTDDLKYSANDTLDKESTNKLDDRITQISADLVTDYQKKEFGNSGIILMPSIKLAQQIKILFNDNGIITDIYVSDDKTIKEKRTILHNFKLGKIRILVSVNAVSKGFDAPIAQFLFDCRPRSQKNGFDGYAQSGGRALRAMIGKNEGRIYDYVGNYDKHGENLAYYFEDGSKVVEIGRTNTKKPIMCPDCNFVLEKDALKCDNCGINLSVECPSCKQITTVLQKKCMYCQAKFGESEKRERTDIEIVQESVNMIELLTPSTTKIVDMVENDIVLLYAFTSTLKYSREIKGFGTDKPLQKLLWRAYYLTNEIVKLANFHQYKLFEVYEQLEPRLNLDCLKYIKQKNQQYKESKQGCTL